MCARQVSEDSAGPWPFFWLWPFLEEVSKFRQGVVHTAQQIVCAAGKRKVEPRTGQRKDAHATAELPSKNLETGAKHTVRMRQREHGRVFGNQLVQGVEDPRS